MAREREADENYIALSRLLAKAQVPSTFRVPNKTTMGYHSFHEICTYLPRLRNSGALATTHAAHS